VRSKYGNGAVQYDLLVKHCNGARLLLLLLTLTLTLVQTMLLTLLLLTLLLTLLLALLLALLLTLLLALLLTLLFGRLAELQRYHGQLRRHPPDHRLLGQPSRSKRMGLRCFPKSWAARRTERPGYAHGGRLGAEPCPEPAADGPLVRLGSAPAHVQRPRDGGRREQSGAAERRGARCC